MADPVSGREAEPVSGREAEPGSIAPSETVTETPSHTEPPNQIDAPSQAALSAAQLGIWSGQQLEPDSPVYNTGEYIEITGQVDLHLLSAAIRQALRESPAARAVLLHDTPEPAQLLGAQPPLVEVIDLRSTADPRAAAAAWMHDDIATVIDLHTGPLYRHALLLLGPETVQWYHRTHHLALDGYGMSLIAHRVAELYTASIESAPPPAPWFGSFEDVLAEEQKYSESDQYPRDQQFWLDYLRDRPQPATLAGQSAPLDTRVNRALAGMDEDQVRTLDELGRSARGTWADALVAAFAAYLHRLSGEEQVCLALPVMLRSGTPALTVPCMALNAIAVWTECDDDTTAQALTEQVLQHRRSSRKHQRYRYEQLRRDLGMVGGARRLLGPSVNIMAFDYDLRFGNCCSEAFNVSAGAVEDMALNVYRRGVDRGLVFALDANPNAYEQRDVEAHLDRFLRFVNNLVARPDTPVSEVDILTPEERTHILYSWNATAQPYPATTIPELWSARMRSCDPGRAAVVGRDHSGQRVSLSAEQLDHRITALRHELQAMGVRRGDTVLLLLDRTVDAIASILAVAATGAAHVYADPDYPPARIALLAEDAQPTVAVTTSALLTRLDGTGIPAHLLVDVELPDAALHPQTAHLDSGAVRTEHLNRPRPQDRLVMVYTSGSTGRPKGVPLSHAGMTNLVAHHYEHLIRPCERRTTSGPLNAALTASLAFDTSWEGLIWLLSGHTVHLIDEDTRREAAEMLDYIDEQGIDFLDLTPTYAEELVSAGFCGPERRRPAIVALGGEAVSAGLWAWLRAMPEIDSVNLYGPSECTVDSTWVRLADHGSPVIGTPIANCRAFVLDRRRELLPPGTVGELYIAGTPVAGGYHRRPDLTAERFVPDPYSGADGPMYRTGDRARWTSSGVLEYLGRVDDQVKIRGVRIETGEIEHGLLTHPAVSRVAVIARETDRGAERLVAYVVPEPGMPPPAPTQLRRHLASIVPYYLVPPTYVLLDRLPLTTNGKLDRAALPEPGRGDSAEPQQDRELTPTEQALLEHGRELLGVDTLRLGDDLFDLGADSLALARLASRIRRDWNVEIELRSLFDTPTIGELAATIDGEPAQLVQEPGHVDLDVECALPADLQLSGQAREPGVRTALLTGATGFLGAHLLRALLSEGVQQVICLVRVADPDSPTAHHNAHRRLCESPALAGLPTADRERIRAIPGDLELPLLGLTQQDFDRLAQDVDLIVHNGARVNHLETYPRLRTANVQGTREVLRLAMSGPPSRVHYVSTINTAISMKTNPSPIPENHRAPAAELLPNGYVYSKWVAEGLVLAAAQRGLVATISRPGRIGGDSATGIGNEDAFWAVLRSILRLGAAPEPILSAGLVDTVPVNKVASAIVYLALKGTTGECYPLHCRTPRPFSALHEAFRARGVSLDSLPEQLWRQRLRAQQEDALAAGDFSPVLAQAHLDALAGVTETLTLDVTTTDARLRAGGLAALTLEPAELARTADWLIRTSAQSGESKDYSAQPDSSALSDSSALPTAATGLAT